MSIPIESVLMIARWQSYDQCWKDVEQVLRSMWETKWEMRMQRRVSFFRSSGRQAVRIPNDFELPGKFGLMRKEGDSIVINPDEQPLSLAVWLVTLTPLGPDDRRPAIDDPVPAT